MEFFEDYSGTPTSCIFASYPFEFENSLSHIFEEVAYMIMPCVEPDYLRKCIKTVIYHEPATIVKWKDGTKTVVKCGKGETFDKEKGLMACIIKKLTGNTGRWNEIIKEWVDYEDS